jgi:glycolate oxidase
MADTATVTIPGPAGAGVPAGIPAVALAALAAAMRDICGPADVITDPLQLRTYECDGLTSHRTVPALVVLPETAHEVALAVRACVRAGVPFVARGSGTGLSGGALPRPSGVLIVRSTPCRAGRWSSRG